MTFWGFSCCVLVLKISLLPGNNRFNIEFLQVIEEFPVLYKSYKCLFFIQLRLWHFSSLFFWLFWHYKLAWPERIQSPILIYPLTVIWLLNFSLLTKDYIKLIPIILVAILLLWSMHSTKALNKDNGFHRAVLFLFRFWLNNNFKIKTAT